MFGHLDKSLMFGRNRRAKDGWGLKIQSSTGLKFFPNSSMSGDVTSQIIRAKEQVNPQAYPGNEEDKPQPSHRRHRTMLPRHNGHHHETDDPFPYIVQDIDHVSGLPPLRVVHLST